MKATARMRWLIATPRGGRPWWYPYLSWAAAIARQGGSTLIDGWTGEILWEPGDEP